MTDKLKVKTNNYDGIASLLPESTVDAYAYANKFTKNLEKGNPAAALSKSKKASAQKNQQREWAIDVFRVHPFWSYDQVVEVVFKTVKIQRHEMANGNPYKLSTVRKAIQGTRGEAAKRFSETSKK